jgi:hypothetical protein
MDFQAPVFPLKVIMSTGSASARKDGGHIGEPSAPMPARSALLGRTLHPSGRQRRAKLRQRDLRLGLETDRRGHMRLVAPLGIVGPVLRQLKSIGDRQPGMMIGDRRRHRHLNWSACRAVRNANGACRRACPITLVNSST